ncbi:papain-like cysteine protease family protein [Bradyrhizobium glycinis]|uniref:papain-like cysteine protease family protein n=1 Tax=Bradyrhizobium glycinis TaxID=2751812 RepID=UPI0018D75090|nr:papain-like cysteine protease family protein [Bradyrhizobium glycinis]MBH5372769.1 hypothetical protein [Bradyrhizobium glycinis]
MLLNPDQPRRRSARHLLNPVINLEGCRVLNVKLDVPLVGQQHGYGGQLNLRRDYAGNVRPHGDHNCWYACACMLSYYFRPGPRLGLPSVWGANVGMNRYQFDWLARTEGLERLEQPDDGFTRDFIAATLIARGPIWAALCMPPISGNKTLLDGHVVVLTGLIEDMLFYNNPYHPAREVIYFYSLLLDSLFVKNPDWL